MIKLTQEKADKYASLMKWAAAIIAPFFAFSHLLTGNDLYKIKTNTGSTIKFTKENVKCDIQRIRLTGVGLNLNRDGAPSSQYKKGDWRYYADCTANGTRKDLVGN